RHVPVCVISTEEAREQSIRLGALGFLMKPVQNKESLEQALAMLKHFVERPVRDLLVVSADKAWRDEVVGLMEGGSGRATTAASGAEALAALRRQPADCVVVSPELPDMTPDGLAGELSAEPALADLPLIVYGKKEASTNGEAGHGSVAAPPAVRRVGSP